MHIVRDKVVDLVIGQISLFLACFDQLFYIVVLVIKSQDRFSFGSSAVGGRQAYSAVGVDTELCYRHKPWKYSTQRSPSTAPRKHFFPTPTARMSISAKDLDD